MRLPSILVNTLILLAALAYLYIATSIGGRLQGAALASLWLGLACTLAAPVAALTQRPKFARLFWGLAIAAIAFNLIEGQLHVNQLRAESRKSTIKENEKLLGKALARLDCSNGDVALLLSNRVARSEVTVLSISIVPADRSVRAHELAWANVLQLPPREQDVRAYLQRIGGNCRSPDYPSLEALFKRVQAHFAAEQKALEAREAGRAAQAEPAKP